MSEQNTTQTTADNVAQTVVVEQQSEVNVTVKKPFFSTGNIAIMGILTAISYILYMFVKFPLPFIFPSFLDIQFSDLPALLGGFAINPLAGVIIIVIKCLLKMPFSITMCVGELADILVGIAFVLPASLFYKKIKNRKGAIIGMGVGIVCAIVISLIANRFLLIPHYAKRMFGGDTQDYNVGMATIVNLVSYLYNGITTENFYSYYLLLAVFPFNLLRCLICGVLTYFTYKPLSKALHWEINVKQKQKVEVEQVVAQSNSNADTQADEQ